MLSIFLCVCWPFVHLLWWNIFSDPLPIFKLVCLLLLSHKGSLYVLDIKPLSHIWIANVFFHSLDHFPLFDGIICRTQVLILKKSNYLVFLLSLMFLMSYPRNYCLIQSHMSLVILVLTFRSITHFELSFVYNEKGVQHHFFSMWISSCHSTICWKYYYFVLAHLVVC